MVIGKPRIGQFFFFFGGGGRNFSHDRYFPRRIFQTQERLLQVGQVPSENMLARTFYTNRLTIFAQLSHFRFASSLILLLRFLPPPHFTIIIKSKTTQVLSCLNNLIEKFSFKPMKVKYGMKIEGKLNDVGNLISR